jgi:hypothetical protein
MDSITWLYIAAIIILIYYLFGHDIDNFINSEKICNEVDGRCYSVITKFNETEKASELLAYLNRFSLEVMRHIRNKYVFEEKGNKGQRAFVKRLLKNYNPDTIIENNPKGNVNTSYVDDKGKVFAICLREKESGEHKFHNKQELEFVVLHEMTHMGTISFGHDMEFWISFKFLIKEAVEAGLHIPMDYKIKPVIYCSLEVDYNPYYDMRIPELTVDYAVN